MWRKRLRAIFSPSKGRAGTAARLMRGGKLNDRLGFRTLYMKTGKMREDKRKKIQTGDGKVETILETFDVC